jgi:hypothetical protein
VGGKSLAGDERAALSQDILTLIDTLSEPALVVSSVPFTRRQRLSLCQIGEQGDGFRCVEGREVGVGIEGEL